MAKKKDNIKGRALGELSKDLAELKENVRVIRFKAEGSRSKNVKEMANLRKQVARIMTEISAQKNK